MKKTVFLVSLLSILLLSSCNGGKPNNNGKGDGEFELPDEIPAQQPENDIHTELQYNYIADEDWTNVKAYVPVTNAEQSGRGIEQSKPRALELDFTGVEEADNYYVEIGLKKDFSDARVLTTADKKLSWNAEIGKKYYYRCAVSEEALAQAAVKEYKVFGAAPRNLNVDGVINFRDVGGWKSSLVKGGYINQGLYYRCAQFNSITAAGKAEIARLNIKVDIDMRDRPPATSPINTEEHPVEILNAAIASGTEARRWSDFGDVYKKIFEACAQADEKPIALHCTHGADRTGIASFFLLALCGVSKEDLGKDYMFTRYAGERAVWHEDEFDGWVSKTEALEGDTFAEKTYNHLHNDFGIEEETLNKVRELFVHGYEA